MTVDPFKSFLADIPDWPGSRKPKNRQNVKRKAETTVQGAKSKVYVINGKDVQLFTIGQLALALNKRTATVRNWEYKGWIPKPSYRTPKPKGQQIPEKVSKGRRLYTLEQVEFLTEAIERFKINDVNHGDWDGFRKYINQEWPTNK